jgi:hypothetical protein
MPVEFVEMQVGGGMVVFQGVQRIVQVKHLPARRLFGMQGLQMGKPLLEALHYSLPLFRHAVLPIPFTAPMVLARGVGRKPCTRAAVPTKQPARVGR